MGLFDSLFHRNKQKDDPMVNPSVYVRADDDSSSSLSVWSDATQAQIDDTTASGRKLIADLEEIKKFKLLQHSMAPASAATIQKISDLLRQKVVDDTDNLILSGMPLSGGMGWTTPSGAPKNYVSYKFDAWLGTVKVSTMQELVWDLYNNNGDDSRQGVYCLQEGAKLFFGLFGMNKEFYIRVPHVFGEDIPAGIFKQGDDLLIPCRLEGIDWHAWDDVVTSIGSPLYVQVGVGCIGHEDAAALIKRAGRFCLTGQGEVTDDNDDILSFTIETVSFIDWNDECTALVAKPAGTTFGLP